MSDGAWILSEKPRVPRVQCKCTEGLACAKHSRHSDKREAVYVCAGCTVNLALDTEGLSLWMTLSIPQ